MNTTSGGQQKDWDETAENGCALPSMDRRHLLGKVAGGLVLATSGLLLPDRLVDEVEAREGANGGELGGRHGSDHKGRHRRRDRDRDRDQHDRQDNARNAPGKPLLRSIKFNIYNGQRLPQDVQVWARKQDSNYNFLYFLKWSDRIAPGEEREYISEDHYLLAMRPDYVVDGGGPIYAEGFNTPIPFVDPTITFGWALPGFTGYSDKLHESTINYLNEGASAKTWGLKATHREDTIYYIRFLIELTDR
jgi:hypothetical protein